MGRAFISTARNRASSVRVGALCSSPRRGQTRDQLLTYDPRRALRTSGPVSEATQTDPSLLGPRWDPIQVAKCGWIAMQPSQPVRTWVQRSLGSPHLVVITGTANMRPGRSPRNMGAGPTLDGRDRRDIKACRAPSTFRIWSASTCLILLEFCETGRTTVTYQMTKLSPREQRRKTRRRGAITCLTSNPRAQS